MPEFNDRKPPVLDDIIEPGLAEKAKPAVDDTQPSLWGEEKWPTEGSRHDTENGGIERPPVNLYDTMEIEVVPDVGTLEDDFEITPNVGAPGIPNPEGNAAGDPAPPFDPGFSTAETDEEDTIRETSRPVIDEAPTGQPLEMHKSMENHLDAGTEPEWPPAAADETERETETVASSAAERVASDTVAFSEAYEPDGAHADARELDALTNRLVRTLIPEIELTLRKRIREILDKSLSGSAHGPDPD